MVEKDLSPKRKNNNSNYFSSTTSKTKSYKDEEDFKELENEKYLTKEKKTLENCSLNLEQYQKVADFLEKSEL